MLGSLAAIIIVFWYYQTAISKGKDPLASAILGFVVYLIPAASWTLLVTPSIRPEVEHSPNFLMALVAQYAYIIIAFACAAWVRYKHFADPK